jgi:mannose/fructose/N-acetylgalactosamine-specific phosphotransferase system component IIC
MDLLIGRLVTTIPYIFFAHTLYISHIFTCCLHNNKTNEWNLLNIGGLTIVALIAAIVSYIIRRIRRRKRLGNNDVHLCYVMLCYVMLCRNH